ncbi:hypothetical protein Daus18300_005284 [Diaporthe australafricana]|uniref:F-box domain-containing protein n=1 Tax=Diaporthe australafricana TaxID=127596 RepID=A0ABR3X2R3_9PEZI
MADQTIAREGNDPDKHDNEWQPTQEVSNLDTIPTEVISLIAIALTVDIQTPYVPFGHKSETSAAHKEKNINACRNLRSLCLVSKRMYFVSREALYRNILATEADTLCLLFRSFLENPKLGTYIKRITFNIRHKGSYSCHRDAFFGANNQIDLRLIRVFAQHGLEQCTRAAEGNSKKFALDNPVEILYKLQFKILSCTSNLEWLDINVHPHSFGYGLLEDVYSAAVTEVLRSLWDETSPCLSRLKNLHLIGKELSSRGRRIRNGFVALLCRRFLALPKLEQLSWFYPLDGWLDILPNRKRLDFDERFQVRTGYQYESIRTLELAESCCLPRSIIALCSTFPHLDSFSIVTHMASKPYVDFKHLMDSLASLENLRTLHLCLHYHDNISRTPGPSEILSLKSLPNLQTLTVPFHFFVKKPPQGQCKVSSPENVLPIR